MKVPNKVVIEISGDNYTHKVLDESGGVIWENLHKMESNGRSRCEKGGDVFDGIIEETFPELAEAIDDLSFGPFGVACKLHDINN